MITVNNLSGIVGVYRVMSELLDRGIYASIITIDDRSDIILNTGKRIQVRRRKITSDGRIRLTTYRMGDNFDYLIVWGYGDKDYFYTIPKSSISHLLKSPKSLLLNPLKAGYQFNEFLDNWKV